MEKINDFKDKAIDFIDNHSDEITYASAFLGMAIGAAVLASIMVVSKKSYEQGRYDGYQNGYSHAIVDNFLK
jgi:hypothetical protein